jgi:hypothetical protein
LVLKIRGKNMIIASAFTTGFWTAVGVVVALMLLSAVGRNL